LYQFFIARLPYQLGRPALKSIHDRLPNLPMGCMNTNSYVLPSIGAEAAPRMDAAFADLGWLDHDGRAEGSHGPLALRVSNHASCKDADATRLSGSLHLGGHLR